MDEGYLADTRVADEEQLEEIVVLACVHCVKVVEGMCGSVTGMGTAKSQGESSGCVNTTAVHVAGRNRPISDVRSALSGCSQHKGNTNCFHPFPEQILAGSDMMKKGCALPLPIVATGCSSYYDHEVNAGNMLSP